MTLILTAQLWDGRASISSSVGQTVANSGATTTLSEAMTASLGDFRIDGVFVGITGVATAQTDAALLADGVQVQIMDTGAGTVKEIVGVLKLYKAGSDRFAAYAQCTSRQPVVTITDIVRCIFRSPDTNAAATGSFNLQLSGRRLRLT